MPGTVLRGCFLKIYILSHLILTVNFFRILEVRKLGLRDINHLAQITEPARGELLSL